MGVFDCLPEVNSCCFSIPLKVGAVIVAIIVIFSSGPVVSLYFVRTCSILALFSRTLSLLYYLMMILAIVTFVAGIAFLIGIFVNLPITAEILLWCLLFSNVGSLLILIGNGVIGMSYGCGFPFIGLASIIVTTLIGFYWMIIVNSYKNQEM